MLRGGRGYLNPVIAPWVERDSKVREWHNHLSKRAKATALNYSRLLHLYWNGNKRFRTFKNTEEWLSEVNNQQASPSISTRRAWGRELQEFLWDYRGKRKKPISSHTQNNLRATVLHFLRYHIGEPETFDFVLGTQEQLKEEAVQREEETPPSREDVKALYAQADLWENTTPFPVEAHRKWEAFRSEYNSVLHDWKVFTETFDMSIGYGTQATQAEPVKSIP